MTEAAKRILDDALGLEPQERVALAHRLWESVDDSEAEAISDEEWEAAWSQEIAGRIEEADSGKVRAIPWEEVKHRLGIRNDEGATG
jgi:putative addiction module component (TIGR02574 family)